jgi:hypothetical protein
MRLIVLSLLMTAMFAGCANLDPEPVAQTEPVLSSYEPHVLVAVPDSGINPYHMTYYREARTAHPCTYIEDFPCEIQPLNFTVGPSDMDWDARYEADADIWANITHGEWYWIPQTVFVAVACEGEGGRTSGVCILDDGQMHGTGTTSSVISENPDAFIAFKEGGPGIEMFADLPVDVFSVSWGHIAPIPAPVEGLSTKLIRPIYVLAAGNDPRSILLDTWASEPGAITVGGAYADGTQEPMAGNQADIVSYFCRPTAQTQSVDEMRPSYCGTSFATPTTAGAISKVILALRQNSTYTGASVDGYVDPILDITVEDVVAAVYRTASYDPEGEYPADPAFGAGIPLNPVAPWVQWGWGFYDGLVADATIAHLLVKEQPAKPMEAELYMSALRQAREASHP